MKSFIAHYSPHEDRRNLLLKSLPSFIKDNMTWIEEEPGDSFLSLFFNSEELWSRRISPFNYGCPVPFCPLSRANISLLYKHYVILNEIANGDEEYSLVLENDVLFSPDFNTAFPAHLASTPADWEVIFIGSGAGLRVPTQHLLPNITAYRKSHPASKCTDSILFKRSAAQKIVSSFFPYVLPIDFELNYQMFIHDLKVYWWEPPLTSQGSQSGLFPSGIQNST